MNAPKRSRARVLTPEGLQKLRERVRSHEADENAGFKYTLERLGELTGLDPETVKNVLDCKGSDKRTIARCFETFGLTLNDSDHIPATQATATADPNFVGRDEAIADLNTLVSRNARVIVIQARGGVGKTTLARKYLQQEFGSFLEFPIAKETKDIASIEGLLEEKLRQLGEEPGREFLVSLDRLKRKLQAERIGILIDNLEPALDSAGKFIEAHRRYVELLRVLSDPIVQSITLITSRERLREADVTVQHYSLRSLDVQAWSQFFQSRSINANAPALATLHDAYGGNAKAMDIISGAVLEDFSGDVEAYWQANQDDLFIERDLEDLVTKQFDRLQELDSDAYKLLCRMGCYRYQDVPNAPIEGLFCLLWDVPDNRYRRVIKSLQDRSLVDSENDEFWLHPVIRAESISRLRSGEDWEVTNRKAANFWTESIEIVDSISDAVNALEAYYHYLEIKDFEKASLVILTRRISRSVNYNSLDLGRSLYRLGKTQQIIEVINRVVNHIRSKYYLSKLYNIIAIPYRITGNIHMAIEFHEKALRWAKEHFEELSTKRDSDVLELKASEIHSLMGIGLCKIALWELEVACDIFKSLDLESICLKVGDLDIHGEVGECAIDSCLAFLYSSLQPNEEAVKYRIDETYRKIKINNQIGTGFRLLYLGMAYKNIGHLGKALNIFHEVAEYAHTFQYFGTYAVTLYHLAEIYREQQNFELAIDHHLKSIAYLGESGALNDLAGAYYQLGLTYQAMNAVSESEEAFQEAIRLFSEMKAPKQVERVRQSMQNSL